MTAVRVEPFTSHYAETAVVHLDYDCAVDAPQRLFLKKHSEHRGRRETAVYGAISAQADFPMITIPCYAAHYDPQTGDSHCLLADLSASHEVVASREAVRSFTAVPTRKQLREVMTVLAQWHAFWWEHPRLQDAWVVWPEELVQKAVFLQFVQEMKLAWQQFEKRVGDDFPNEWRRRIEHLLTMLPIVAKRYFWPRFEAGEQLTLAHGDCYFGNFLYPRDDGENGRTVLFDFDNVHVNFSGEDLVLLLATFWLPTQRRQYERNLLEQYHVQLHACGVTGYGWKDLVRDYRLGIIWRLFHPVWGMVNGEQTAHWQAKMGCLMSAYEDWHCWEFIEEVR